ncbi:dienelactone hydrolase family protein [Anaerolineales bacterium]
METIQPAGFLALPSANIGHPVLVLHAWWGLNETIKTFCSRLAAAGFVAFAPDLYQGALADQIEEAHKLSRQFSQKEAEINQQLDEAIQFLKGYSQSEEAGITVIGFSFGAYFALELSTTKPESIRSVIVFYGTGPRDFSASKSSYLGHFADQDEYEPQSEVDALRAALEQAGRPAEIYQYANTGHWFFEADRSDAYQAEAAELAWERSLTFLKEQAAQ